MRGILIIILFVLYHYSAKGQFQVRDSALFDPHVSISYASQWPALDMDERFGRNNNIGIGFHIKSKKNWYYGIQGTFLFGNKVKEPGLLSNLAIDEGFVLDNQGQLSKIAVQQRGFSVTLEGGKIFDIIGPNRNSGLLVMGGVGLLQHKIRLEHQENEITQLDGDYIKGYDRLSNGLMVHQFVGYFHMSNNRLINFFIGAEAWQGFTKSRRDLNFDTKLRDDKNRTDILFGLRAGWVLHLYQRSADEYYFN